MVGTRKRGLVQSSLLETLGDKQQLPPPPPKKKKIKQGAKKDQELDLKVFLNPLILQKIAQHLPTPTLMLLRATCKVWNKLMVAEYRKRTDSGGPTLNSKSMLKLIDTLKGCEQEEIIPFTKYKFALPDLSAPEFQGLISKIGCILTHLDLELGRDSILPISTFRTLLLKQAPGLVALQVTDARPSRISTRFWNCNLHHHKEDQEQQQQVVNLPNLNKIILILNMESFPLGSTSFALINQLFNSVINLEVASIVDYNSIDNFQNRITLRALAHKTTGLSKLNKIKFWQQVSLEDVQNLVGLSTGSAKTDPANKLALKSFNLSNLSKDCFIGAGLDVLQQFLALQSPTLEKLTAALYSKSSNVRLPIMPVLKTLKLQSKFNHVDNNHNHTNNIQFESLAINFPNLSTLKLMDMDWMMETNRSKSALRVRAAKWATFSTQLGDHPGVTKLNMILHDDPNYLEDAATHFPNVSSLKLKFETRIFPSVWSLWPELESLDLDLELDEPKEAEIDSSLTGIPAEKLIDLRKGKAVVNPARLKNWRKYKTCDGISDLQNLREFNLQLNGRASKSNYKYYITNFSGYYGLACLHHLEEFILIDVLKYFSPACINMVKAALGLYGEFTPVDKELDKRIFKYHQERRSRLRLLGLTV